MDAFEKAGLSSNKELSKRIAADLLMLTKLENRIAKKGILGRSSVRLKGIKASAAGSALAAKSAS